jgi:beta-glucosidase
VGHRPDAHLRRTLGAEQWGKGTNVVLGPTINIVRDPRWGRAFESFGEDPYLAGQASAADIQGIQAQGPMAQVKHYAVYNQETNRNRSTSASRPRAASPPRICAASPR